MRPATLEERLRDHIASERTQVSVPPQMALRILRAVEASRPAQQRPYTGMLQFATALAFVLLLASGIAWMRAAQSASRLVHGTWSTTGTMADNRGYHTATLLADGRVLVVGGLQIYRVLGSAELYDPRTRQWSPAGSLPTPSWGHTATLLQNGKILVVGGSSADGDHMGSTSRAELYDPQTNSWSAAASMHTPRSFHTATLLPDGRVLVVGGFEASSDVTGNMLASAELYDPAMDAWSLAPRLTVARAKHDAILLANHNVLVLGGTEGVGYNAEVSRSLRTAELFDPMTETWSTVGSMQYGRILPTAILLPDDRVLVVGDEAIHELTAEVFDPANERWSLVAALDVPRADAVAFELNDATIVVAGGVGQTSVQAFDRRTGTWIHAGDMPHSRASATATVLANGQVLVAGGWGRLSMPWASAELYDPNGTSAIAVFPTRAAPVRTTGLAVLIGTATLLFGLGLSIRRRVVRQSRAGQIWID
jgi:N-acetylneuraminic acid mutarotase